MATHVQTVTTAHAVESGHHHDHDHRHDSFWTKYIFSQDHKTIAKQFLITGFVSGFIGILLSGIFRLQLAFPDTSFPFLETILGKWAPEGRLDPNFYMALVTMHGTILVFWDLFEPTDPATDWGAGYGLASYQYAFIPLFLLGDGSADGVFLLGDGAGGGGLDGISTS
jgi:hypothetical protein